MRSTQRVYTLSRTTSCSLSALLVLACASCSNPQQRATLTDEAPPQIQLSTYIGWIRGSNWSPDGRRIVAWSNRTVAVFDAETSETVYRTSMPAERYVASADFSPDSRWLMLASGGAESTWVDIEQHELVAPNTPQRWRAAALDKSWLFSEDSSQILWLERLGDNEQAKFAVVMADATTHRTRLRIELPALGSAARDMVQSPDGKLIAVSGEEKLSFVRLEDGKRFDFEQTPEGSAIAFDARSGRVAWLVLGGVAVWDGKSEAPKILRDPRCLRPEPSIPNSSPGIFSPTEDLLAMPASDNRVCVWDLSSSRVRVVLPRTPAPSEVGPALGMPVTWGDDGRSLVMFDGDGTYYDWDLAKHTPVTKEIVAIGKAAGGHVVLTTPVAEDYERHVLVVRSNGGGRRELPISDCFLGRNDSFDDLAFAADDWVVVRCSPRPAVVHLTDGEIRRLPFEHWGELRLNAPSKLLALESRFGLSVYDVVRNRLRAQLLSDGGWDSNGDESSQYPYLEMNAGSMVLESRGHKRVNRWRIDYWGQRMSLGVEGIGSQPCDAQQAHELYRVGSHYAWSSPAGGAPGVLWNLPSCEVLGRFALQGPTKVMTINRSGTAAVVGGYMADYLWRSELPEPVALPPGHQWSIDGTTLVGVDYTGAVVVYDALIGQQRTAWQRVRLDTNLATEKVAVNAALGLVFTGRGGHELYRLDDGSFVGALPPEEDFDAAALGSNAVLATSLGSHVKFWSIPSLELLGELQIDGTEAVFIAANGEFETTGNLQAWSSKLSCRSGEVKLPFERCVERLYRPGIATSLLGL